MSKFENNQYQVEILGHRGAKDFAPENTIASFQAALDAGVDMIELDVHLSKDSELIVIHDPELRRTTNGQGMVSDYSLEDLKTLDAAENYSGPGSFGTQRIPTLQEVYDLVGDQVAINVEIKTAADSSRYPGIEKKVIELVRRNGAVSTTVVSSFDFPSIQYIQKLESSLACYGIVSAGYFNKMVSDDQGDERVVADFIQHGFQQVAINKQFLSKNLMYLLKQAGFKVGVWIVNDVAEMWRYIQMGVDRITTDRPDQLMPALNEVRK